MLVARGSLSRHALSPSGSRVASPWLPLAERAKTVHYLGIAFAAVVKLERQHGSVFDEWFGGRQSPGSRPLVEAHAHLPADSTTNCRIAQCRLPNSFHEIRSWRDSPGDRAGTVAIIALDSAAAQTWA